MERAYISVTDLQPGDIFSPLDRHTTWKVVRREGLEVTAECLAADGMDPWPVGAREDFLFCWGEKVIRYKDDGRCNPPVGGV